jgi:hypothetical protein
VVAFDAGSFADVARTALGEALWRYLNSDDAWIRLETTTFLRRPAVEGIQPQLKARFGAQVEDERCRQLIGRMVRQIMERRGYVLDQTGVRTRVGGLFKAAARYRELAGA